MRLLEFTLWVVGIALMAFFLGATAWGESARQHGVSTFPAAQPTGTVATQPTGTVATGTLAIAVLRIPGIKLEVPVGYGTDEGVLRRGAGLVEGTAAPGTRGNVAIAGHRDTFFRGLENVAVGDLVELETFDRRLTYRITTLSVVEPTDVHVLADSGESELTLVTCYPFYFVGSAPQRFIVRAVVADAST